MFAVLLQVAWHENDGTESFAEHDISTNAPQPYTAFAVDVDSDGAVDVLSASYSSFKVMWYENDCVIVSAPTAAPTSPAPSSPPSPVPSLVPSLLPTATPSSVPTAAPTAVPSPAPSPVPSTA